MRIGIPGFEQYSARRGIGRYATTLASLWQRWGHEVVPVRFIQTRVPGLRNLAWGLPREDLRHVDVIFLPNFLGAEALLFSRTVPRVVSVVHDVGGVDCLEDRKEQSLLSNVLYRLSLYAVKLCTRVASDSEFTRSRLIHHTRIDPSRVVTIYPGVDHRVFKPGDRLASRRDMRARGLAVSDEDTLMIYVGAEYRRKNLPFLIDAFAAYYRKGAPGAKLLKVGNGHDAKARARTLDQMRRRGLRSEQDVLFVENINDELLAELYCSSDVFVTASKYEGFGLPLLEALSCGKEAVAARSGALPEVGGVGTRYVDVHQPADFAAAMEAAALDAHRNPLGNEAGITRARGFDWTTTARSVLRLLEEAACVEHR